MAKINVLDKHIAELIAAGEVVERPSSVVKELVENAVDAKATVVTVEIKNGGVTYIRVTDNGCGIEKEDIEKAFLRHATSKIQTEDNLSAIATLGFRGEALASIAAMAKVEVLSRVEGSLEGVRYVIHGGEDQESASAGCPVGTTFVVRDLFYNTPARMKFLKKDSAESSAVASVLDKIALSHPEISFKLIKDGTIKLHTPGDGQLLSAIYTVFGKEFANTLIPVDNCHGPVRITGYTVKPTEARSNRTMQNFFINSRFVKTKTAMAALEEAYRHSIMVGKFPACVLNIEIPFQTVDVNVHPAKIEVRFSDEKIIFDCVYYGIKGALAKYDTISDSIPMQKSVSSYMDVQKMTQPAPQQHLSSVEYRQMAAKEDSVKKNSFTDLLLAHTQTSVPQSENSLTFFDTQPSTPAVSHKEPVRVHILPNSVKEVTPVSEPAEPTLEDERYLRASIVGELFGTYILLQNEDKLILIDKHAAHERLLFEQLKQSTADATRQVLLSPQVVTLSKEDYTAAIDQIEQFLTLGFLIEDFGGSSVIVYETPLILPKESISLIIEEIAHKIASLHHSLTPQCMEELLHSIACRTAIKAHDKSSRLELETILRLLRENQDIKYCPHGRPIATSIQKNEIEKMFGRL